jgi:hypothetical protein
MKKIIIITILGLSILGASNLKIGLNTMNFQDSEGGGIALFYKYKENLFFETSYNESYIRGVKNNQENETWNRFNTQKLGIRYYLKSYLQDEIRLFLSVGLENIYKNYELSSSNSKLNSYGLLGTDFAINEQFNISFAFGSGGKGANADQLKSSPNYAHGFITLVGIEYTLP